MFMQGLDPLNFHDVRHLELLEEARQYRLLQQALGSTTRKYRFFSRSLASLGRNLSDWGTRLEKRYGTSPSERKAETA